MNNSKTFLNLEDELHSNLEDTNHALKCIMSTEREIIILKKGIVEKRKAMNAKLSKSVKAFDKLMKMDLPTERKKLVGKMGWNIQKTVNKIGKYID